jgi:hypothetical protein
MAAVSPSCHDGHMLMRIFFWLLGDGEPVWTDRPF